MQFTKTDRGRVIIEIHSHFRNVTISSSNNQDMVTSQLESNHGLIRHLQSNFKGGCLKLIFFLIVQFD